MDKFIFTIGLDEGCSIEEFYGTREAADKKFDQLTHLSIVVFAAYYNDKVGGLVNLYHRD